MQRVKRDLGRQIKTLRQLRGYTQEALGERAGLSYKFIGEVERAEVNPSLESLLAIAKAFEVEIGELFPSTVNILAEFDAKEIKTIKKAVKLLNGSLSKI